MKYPIEQYFNNELNRKLYNESIAKVSQVACGKENSFVVKKKEKSR